MSVYLSVVVPAFNEEGNIPAVTQRIARLLDGLGYRWELILVDDGSRDGTFAEMREAAAAEPRVRALRFSRNFGSHAAITAGLEHARGDACLVITADLEEPPEMIAAFVEKWREGHEIVWGLRAERVETTRVRAASSAFHWLSRLMGVPEYDGKPIGGGFFLVDRKVVEVLRRLKERNRTLVGLLSWMGFRQGHVYYQPSKRHSGASKWTPGKKVKLAIDSFVSFSYLPIRLVSGLGVVISMLSFLYGLGIVLAALFMGVAVQGWPTMMATVLFLSGVQLLVTGMIGEYIWRGLDETRGRPLYIVADAIEAEWSPHPNPLPAQGAPGEGTGPVPAAEAIELASVNGARRA
jgi:dolichol-phosphate mannosyltransferase